MRIPIVTKLCVSLLSFLLYHSATATVCTETYKSPEGRICIVCPRGYYKVADCAVNGSIAICTLCGKNEFQPYCSYATSCAQCSHYCPSKYMKTVKQCSRISDMKCECLENYYWQAHTSDDGVCLHDNRCPAGQGKRNGQCIACVTGETFSDSLSGDTCLNCTVCIDYDKICTLFQDAVCQKVSGKNIENGRSYKVTVGVPVNGRSYEVTVGVTIGVCACVAAVVTVVIFAIYRRRNGRRCFYRHDVGDGENITSNNCSRNGIEYSVIPNETASSETVYLPPVTSNGTIVSTNGNPHMNNQTNNDISDTHSETRVDNLEIDGSCHTVNELGYENDSKSNNDDIINSKSINDDDDIKLVVKGKSGDASMPAGNTSNILQLSAADEKDDNHLNRHTHAESVSMGAVPAHSTFGTSDENADQGICGETLSCPGEDSEVRTHKAHTCYEPQRTKASVQQATKISDHKDVHDDVPKIGQPWRKTIGFLSQKMKTSDFTRFFRILADHDDADVWIDEIKQDFSIEGVKERQFQLLLKWRQTLPSSSEYDIIRALKACELNEFLMEFQSFVEQRDVTIGNVHKTSRSNKIMTLTAQETHSGNIEDNETTNDATRVLVITKTGQQIEPTPHECRRNGRDETLMRELKIPDAIGTETTRPKENWVISKTDDTYDKNGSSGESGMNSLGSTKQLTDNHWGV